MAENPNIKKQVDTATSGMNLERSVGQIPKGSISYGLNAVVENFDSNSINYQNEEGNVFCLQFPVGYQLIGSHYIVEQSKHIFFLANPINGGSEIGYMVNNNCIYITYINTDCLNFDINHPIQKIVHKITDCATEIYWPDQNGRRYINLNELPYKTKPGTNVCENEKLPEIDCNKIKVQPNFNIPILEVVDVVSGGNLTAGTVQFAIQYSDAASNGYTSYYSVTNPTPIANSKITTSDFNYPVGKSVVLNISNLDITGYFEYFNLAVIKTINNITSYELIGTFFIDNTIKKITYTGQNQTQIRLTANDIFEKVPFYELAEDITTVQDVLVWKGLTSIDRINYQQIANKITLQWETWRIPEDENYSDELNATNIRGQLRDEVYPYEICFLLDNGKETDGFHIPGRIKNANEFTQPDVKNTDPDFIGDFDSEPLVPYWRVYNTASVIGTSPDYSSDSKYKGPYQYGEFAYWESTELYPCNTDVWGELANTPIRHHKFPDVLVSPIFENPSIEIDSVGKYAGLAMQKNAIYPIGVRIDTAQIQTLIDQSNLSTNQKASIVGFKILRGNRDVNKSIIAKGILRNIGKYDREGTEYYFPNYPYNDLREDPFLLAQNNGYNSICNTYNIDPTSDGVYQYTDCLTNSSMSATMTNNETVKVCSISTPIIIEGTGTVEEISFDTYVIRVNSSTVSSGGLFRYTNTDNIVSSIVVLIGEEKTVEVKSGTIVTLLIPSSGINYSITQTNYLRNDNCYPERLSAFETDDSKYRQVFNSPETSFGQPFLGDVLKLESVIFGAGIGHFVEVKKNALYRLVSKEAQEDALKSSGDIADTTGTFDSTAMFTAYQAYLQIYLNGITRKNYGWSYNSIASYDYYADIANGVGIKQRMLDSSQYLIPGVQSIGDVININNYQRESSVYLKTIDTVDPLPFPSKTDSLVLSSGESRIEDKSRYINSQIDCSQPEKQFDISTVCYYASLKNININQWGQIYSYETIDTGFQVLLSEIDSTNRYRTVFGGDTFISKFAFKTKLPFFIDNRVNAPDESDIFYDEIGNVAYPEYWHSARSIFFDYTYGSEPVFKNIISIKAHYFDCPNNQLPAPDDTATPPIVNPNRTFYDGKMYMFAYGIPNFYCETSINVDLRQAFNNREGDFFPHISSGIPDDWLQESFVPIVQDNTYYYNVTFSKQNKENNFTHLPVDWESKFCFTNFPFRAIYSDSDGEQTNGWLVYRPISYFDFPQNYGELTSLDGIDNRQVLARFENKTLIYNALYTTQTNTGGQVYLGQSLFSTNSPPLDYAETDLGYIGSQHKFLLKIPQGQVTIDAKRGQIFLLSGTKATDISALGTGLTRFLTDHLPFEISKYFPSIDIDNNFNGIGLHGVYDSKYKRVIISKLDYSPLSGEIKWDSVTNEFYIELIYPEFSTTTTTTTNVAPIVLRKRVYLSDPEYFCNKSWTLSYNLNTNSWISFHSYIPNWYIADNNFFYSGINEGCDLEIIAFEEIPTPTTTTTSSTSTTTTSTSTTTTTTTTAPPTTTTTTSSSTSTTTTSTSTSTSSTTTTTTTMEPLAGIDVSTNISDDVAINSISVNGIAATLVGGVLPNTPGNGAFLETNQIGTYDVTVNCTSSLGGQRIQLTGSDGTPFCEVLSPGTGNVIFLGVVVNTSVNVLIEASVGSC